MCSLQRLVGAALLLAACASSQAVAPHEMSSVKHEREAQKEEQAALAHTDYCAKGAPCWTSEAHPSDKQKADAEAHLQHAEKHRAAAQALRDAEAAACSGMSLADIATSPFYHREEIVSVAKVNVAAAQTIDQSTILAGGQAVFRAMPGLTAEWLQRLVQCHQARAAAVGFDIPELSYCPLALKGARASVTSVGDGFAISVTADDPATVAEIWRRIEASGSPVQR
jgi:hypothetical protein